MNSIIINSDARHIPLASGSVQCVVTSPPYYGLRDYGTKDQIGAEVSPQEYVYQLMLVFREVWRVLRNDGTLWLNLGDTYVGGKGGSGSTDEMTTQKRFENGRTLNRGHQQAFGGKGQLRPSDNMPAMHELGLKRKELIGIPWRVAFALQSQGWYLRSDIIWAKTNCMPESVTDRPTRAHEYLFLLTKSPRYYYDAAAIREPVKESSLARLGRAVGVSHKMVEGAPGQKAHTISAPRFGGRKASGYQRATYSGKEWIPKMAGGAIGLDSRKHLQVESANKRSVWAIPTANFDGAHFATFPEELVMPCVLAGSKAGDVILDPFTGSGTTGVVCSKTARHFVGCELNISYGKMACERLSNTQPGFALEVAA